ncbi:MAG: EamA family transporter RarD [Hyphomonadaceae bacterium]
MTAASVPADPHAEIRAGFLAALVANISWGLLPIYLKLVGFAPPMEILAQRILWCVPAAFVGVLIMSGWSKGLIDLRAAMRPAILGALALSAVFIFGNWGLYVWAVATDRVMEAAMAYFIAPMVQVGLGVLLFGERMSRLQWGALAFAALGVSAQGAALGAMPWVALLMCASWCAYGVMRKRIVVPAAVGLFVESVLLIPAAIVLLMMVGPALAYDDRPANIWLLALAGPVTAIPLTLFSFGARRIKFSTIGLLQFLPPSLQFLLGLYWGEPLNTLRIVSFALIWVGLVFFVWDMWRRERLAAKPA